ncbi:MAG: hypothetical protein K2Z80_10250 [Xanthobacteraceae bacterium]|nr:hypothetical protein [Xanthobacteraceae bacterium]
MMHHRFRRRSLLWLLAAALLGGVSPLFAQGGADGATAASPAVEAYIRARTAYEQEAEAYWQSIADTRRARFAKRRSGERIVLADYVLEQPPVYTGPPRPPEYVPPRRDPERPPVPVPTIPEFLAAAKQQYNFAPDRPRSETEFKQAYAKVATAAGLTREQAVRIYAFETGGNGEYDTQAGLTSNKNAKPISPAIGYNQLLSTNSVSLLANHGDKFLTRLSSTAATLVAADRKAMDRKVEALQKMVAFSRSVPNSWSEHDKLAKFTEGGKGIHAAILDRDIGPLLQTQKLLDSVVFAKARGFPRPLAAVELELMNFTGDGNGFDMVTMPHELRDKVPTSNFFQRGGYERNPIARRTGTVAALFESIDGKMDRASQLPGAKALAGAF